MMKLLLRVAYSTQKAIGDKRNRIYEDRKKRGEKPKRLRGQDEVEFLVRSRNKSILTATKRIALLRKGLRKQKAVIKAAERRGIPRME